MRGALLSCLLAWLVAVPFWAQAQAPVEEAPTPEEEEAGDPLDALPDAEPLAWTAGVSQAELRLAEPFTVSVEIKHPASERYELRPMSSFEPFGVREKREESVGGEAEKTSTLRLVLQPFRTGEVEVPALRFLVHSAAGAMKFDVPAQRVRVRGVIDPAQGQPQMREDLRPLMEREVIRWWPLLALALLALAAGLFVWLRRRAARPPAPPPPVPRDPPDVEALARLQALEAERLIGQGRYQEHYFRLTELLRDYLGRRYGFDALELTTEELLRELRTRPTPGLSYDDLSAFLQGCDLVKFARSVPTDGEAKAVGERVRETVLRTRALPEKEEALA